MQAKDLLVTGDVRVVGDIYSPSLDFTPTLTSGTQVGTIKMNGKTTNIYAPAGGGSATGAAANYTLAKSGNKIQLKKDGTLVSEVTDDDTKYTIPTVPTVGNGTLTIQRNGTTVATFSANQSGNTTANISVPTIPSVGDGTLTIQRNGTNVATFTANQSSGATANILVPTKVSELTNDSGYTTAGGHTHNYAGSSSAGGAADAAVALTGGPYVVVSATEPNYTNTMIWVKTTS